MPVAIQANADGTATFRVNGVDAMSLSTTSLTAPAVSIAGTSAERIQAVAVQSTASGTFVDFAIPAWARKITMNLVGVSTTGTQVLVVNLGTSAGIATTGYQGSFGLAQNAASSIAGLSATSFGTSSHGSAADTRHGNMTLCQVTGTNTWTISGLIGNSASANIGLMAGSVALPSALTTVRLATQGGDSFDAGTVSLLIEG